MNRTILKYGLIVAAMFHALAIYAQKVDKAELSAVKDELLLSVRIKDCKSSQKFYPLADFYYENGERIGTNTIQYKTGNNFIACGSSDVLLWKPSTDKLTINQPVYAVLNVKTELEIELTPHIIKSLVFPGLGDYRLRNGKVYFMYGLAGYGLIATALSLQNKATQNYDLYKSSHTISESNDLYDKAVKQRNLSYMALASAAVVWTVDIAALTKKYKSVKANPSLSNYYTALADKTFSAKSNIVHFDNRNDFEIAMDMGKSLVQKADELLTKDENSALTTYQQAEQEYQKALKISGQSEKAQIELESVQQKISTIEQKKAKYNQLIADADAQLRNAEYDKAQTTYNQALALYPDAEYPKQQLKEVEKAKANQQLQNNYNEIIAKADKCLKEKKFDEAKSLYAQASTLKPSEQYPKLQIEICEQQKIQSQYDAIIVKADAQFRSKNYEEAERLYNDALVIKTNESYPMAQIDKCRQLQKQKSCNALVAKGNSAYNAQKYKEAKSYYEEAYAVLPSVEIKNKIDLCQQKLDDQEWNDLMQKANIAFAKDDYETALKLYQQADAVKPNQPKTIEQIIACKKEMKKNDVDFPTLISKNKNSVVYLEHNKGTGSGFIISSDGVMVSNYHVCGKYWRDTKVKTYEGRWYSIESIISSSENDDYIIFKVKSLGDSFSPVKLATEMPLVGEQVFTLGHPRGLTQTSSQGTVTGFIGFDNSYGYIEGDFYIQTDATIYEGSSGGALFNTKGEVIGITCGGVQAVRPVKSSDGVIGLVEIAAGDLNLAINILKIKELNKYR